MKRSDKIGNTEPFPQDYDELETLMRTRYDNLPKRLQQVSKFALDNPEIMAFEALATIAAKSKNHASTVVRFAQTMGFNGATDMQRLFREHVLDENKSLSYEQRIRSIATGAGGKNPGLDGLLSEFIEGSILTLDRLRDSVDIKELKKAIYLINTARNIYLAGFRRSYPVVAYLNYSLHQIGRPVHLINGLGGMRRQESSLIGKKDVLVATTFQPYADETIECVTQAQENGGTVVAITDSVVSPIANKAAATLVVKDVEVRGFRSLSASLCLAQTVAISLAIEDARK